jgi:hypothetical protein
LSKTLPGSYRDFGLPLTAHTSFGLYVVLVKYLLDYLPSFRMLAVAFGLAVLATFLIARRQLNWRRFWSIEMWVIAGIVVARSVFKLLALQFTLAMYVQLLDLIVPFLTPDDRLAITTRVYALPDPGRLGGNEPGFLSGHHGEPLEYSIT